MGITLFTFAGAFAPLQSLVGWMARRSRRTAAAQPVRCSAAPHRAPRPRPGRPLRVVRVVEGSGAPASAGRMFISGRMADVCAELDRLAALETAAG